MMINPNNDSDLATLNASTAAARLSNAKRKGVCTHERRQHAQLNFSSGWDQVAGVRCLDCGKTATWAELEEDRQEWL